MLYILVCKSNCMDQDIPSHNAPGDMDLCSMLGVLNRKKATWTLISWYIMLMRVYVLCIRTLVQILHWLPYFLELKMSMCCNIIAILKILAIFKWTSCIPICWLMFKLPIWIVLVKHIVFTGMRFKAYYTKEIYFKKPITCST